MQDPCGAGIPMWRGHSHVARALLPATLSAIKIQWSKASSRDMAEPSWAESRIRVEQRFSVCVRTAFSERRWSESCRNPAPEGRAILAPRFSAGISGEEAASPGGTAEFSCTHFRAAFRSTWKMRFSPRGRSLPVLAGLPPSRLPTVPAANPAVLSG